MSVMVRVGWKAYILTIDESLCNYILEKMLLNLIKYYSCIVKNVDKTTE